MKYFRFWIENSSGQTMDIYEKGEDEISATLSVYEDHNHDDVSDPEEISEEEYDEFS